MILKTLSAKELQLQKLIEIYRRAEIQIEKELTRKRALDLVDYAERAALKRVQQTLAEMTAQAEEQAPIAIESFFDTTAESLTTTKTNVVNTLVNNYMGKIDEAAEATFESAKEYLAIGRLAADEFRTLSLERVAEATAIGKGWRDAQRKMAIDLNNKGITAFTDKAGRQWDLTGYCSMLTRTTARQAQVAATLTENDHDLWQILPHGTTCALCAAYQGRVYSKSGLDPDYPPLSSAFGKIDPLGANDLSNTYLNIHVNCLCTLAPYTTMGKTDEEIEKDKKFSSFEKRPANVDYRTEQQRDEYRAKEKARAEYRNTKKQFEKYKAAGVDDMPVRLSTFEKNKRANTDKYKEWERKFREINKSDKKAIEAVTEAVESPKGFILSEYEQNKEAINATLRTVELGKVNKRIEIADIIDRKGNITFTTDDGDKNSVRIPESLSKNNIVTHNHPNGGCFSAQDLATMGDDDMLELRVSTPDKTFYSMRKVVENPNNLTLAMDFQNSAGMKATQDEITRLIKEGTNTEKDVTYEFFCKVQDRLKIDFLEKHASDYGYMFTKGVHHDA